MKSKLKIIVGWMLIAFTFIYSGCEKDTHNGMPAGTVPLVTIDSVNYNHFTDVYCAGTVIDTGSSYVQEFGFCWSKNHNPEANGAGSSTIYSPYLNYGHFSGNVEPLDYGSIYYVRAFASNKDGHGYSAETKIQTNAEQRTFYPGQWLVSETFTKQVYIVEIVLDEHSSTDILIYNFANLGDTITPAVVHVSGPIVTLPLDLVIGDGFLVNGSGFVSEDDNILWNYTINDGNDLLPLIATYSRSSD